MSFTYVFAFQDTPTATGHTAQFTDTAGTNVGSAISTGFTEIGGGHYLWTGTIPTGHQGAIKILRAGNTITVGAINPQDAENTDVATSTRIATGGTISYTGPVATTGDVTITRGDDYSTTDGRALTWTTTTAAEWPTLTGATILLTVYPTTGPALTKAGTVTQSTGANKAISVELAAADTNLGIGTHRYDIQATISGRKVTLVKGNFTVRQDVSA